MIVLTGFWDTSGLAPGSFIDHWNAVNAVLPTKTLALARTALLPEGMTLDGLIDLRDEIATDFARVVAADNLAQEKQAQRKTVQAFLPPGHPLLTTLPTLG